MSESESEEFPVPVDTVYRQVPWNQLSLLERRAVQRYLESFYQHL